MSAMRVSALGLCVLAGLSLSTGCGGEEDGIQNPVRETYDLWQKVELPGTVCGNGSQYKFFVNYSDQTDNVVVVFEPGGACWDYPSCTGASGIRGAANPDGLRDDHYELAPFISPFLQREDPTSPPDQVKAGSGIELKASDHTTVVTRDIDAFQNTPVLIAHDDTATVWSPEAHMILLACGGASSTEETYGQLCLTINDAHMA